jgi:hypothetical protein
MIYPEAIEVNGVEYEINTSYEDAIACIRCINDPDISDIERAYGVIGILYKEEPPDLREAVRLAIKYLQLDREPDDQNAPHKLDMDFDCDVHYIRASFMSDYRIDLTAEPDMHWWRFWELLQGLTDDCILNRVRDIRNYDLSTVKDAKTRGKIIKAQRDVALPERVSQEDQDLIDAFYSQLK